MEFWVCSGSFGISMIFVLREVLLIDVCKEVLSMFVLDLCFLWEGCSSSVKDFFITA